MIDDFFGTEKSFERKRDAGISSIASFSECVSFAPQIENSAGDGPRSVDVRLGVLAKMPHKVDYTVDDKTESKDVFDPSVERGLEKLDPLQPNYYTAAATLTLVGTSKLDETRGERKTWVHSEEKLSQLEVLDVTLNDIPNASDYDIDELRVDLCVRTTYVRDYRLDRRTPEWKPKEAEALTEEEAQRIASWIKPPSQIILDEVENTPNDIEFYCGDPNVRFGEGTKAVDGLELFGLYLNEQAGGGRTRLPTTVIRQSGPVFRGETPVAWSGGYNYSTTSYTINVKTKNKLSAGTNAHIYITLVGDDGQEVELPLSATCMNPRTFEGTEMNSDDRWIHKDVKQFIELEAIKLRHSDTGWKAGWHPEYVEITDHKTGNELRVRVRVCRASTPHPSKMGVSLCLQVSSPPLNFCPPLSRFVITGIKTFFWTDQWIEGTGSKTFRRKVSSTPCPPPPPQNSFNCAIRFSWATCTQTSYPCMYRIPLLKLRRRSSFKR